MSNASGSAETSYASIAPATTNFADAARAHVESADHLVIDEASHQSGIIYEI